MILWWRCPSGQTADARCASLTLAARGLLWTLADFADGTGEVPTGALTLEAVLRGAAPHDGPDARASAWQELADAGLVEVEAGAIYLHLAARDVAATGDTAAMVSSDRGQASQKSASDSARARKKLDAWASRYDLGTPEKRAEWVALAGASRVAEMAPAVLEAWVEAAGRRGGRFGHERSQHRSQHPPSDGSNTGANVGTVDGSNSGSNAPSPSHSPSEEKDTEKEGERAGRDGSNTGANAGANTPARSGANVGTVTGANTLAERIEDALLRRSAGRVDLLSAPASSRQTLRTLLAEMQVDVPLAERMGELAARPQEMWPWLRESSPRVTVAFLVGKVDNNGQRDARPLVELVSRARAELASRAASPSLPAEPARPKAVVVTAEDTAEALRIAAEAKARRTASPTPARTPETSHVA